MSTLPKKLRQASVTAVIAIVTQLCSLSPLAAAGISGRSVHPDIVQRRSDTVAERRLDSSTAYPSELNFRREDLQALQRLKPSPEILQDPRAQGFASILKRNTPGDGLVVATLLNHTFFSVT